MTRDSDPSTVLVLRRVRTVEGRVVDRQGQPVAGAVVRQSGDGPMPTETLTAAIDGRFRLPGVIEGPALVFAEKEGFRFGFRCRSTTDRNPAEVVLARTGEPPAVAYQTLPPALPVEEEKALARRLIQPSPRRSSGTARTWRNSASWRTRSPSTRSPCSSGWSRSSSPMPIISSMLRMGLAEALARESLDEATAMLEASDAADVRAGGYLGICDVRRDLRPDQVKELLAQAE